MFLSCQGEGPLVGTPMVFVRLAGCNLRCGFCDTAYAQDPDSGEDVSVEDIVRRAWELHPRLGSWIAITGGEPLIHKDLRGLVRALRSSGYMVEVETNGSFEPPHWHTLVGSWIADIKCPSSGVCGVSSLKWLNLRSCDTVKFVVGDIDDLRFVERTLASTTPSASVLVSPVADMSGGWDRDWLQTVWGFCCDHSLRFGLQLHKVVFGNRRGV